MRKTQTPNMLARAVMTLFAVLCFSGGLKAQNSLTIYEDAEKTSSYVPVYGMWADAYLKCEFIVPDSELIPMSGGAISQMTFYLSSPASAAWTGTFQVFLKEVESATISAYSGTDDATIVYTGTLDATGSTMSIDFQDTYTYGGGNLLVGIYQTEKGIYKSASFIGAEVTGASIGGYSSSSLDEVGVNPRNFIPKTTFSYIPGGSVFYFKPNNLTVDDLTDATASLSWTAPSADVASYVYQYKEASEEDWGDEVAVTETTVSLDDLLPGTSYDFRVKAVYNDDGESGYATTTFMTEFCAEGDKCFISYELTDSYGDGWSNNAIKVVDVETGVVLDTWTIAGSISSASGSLAVCTGREIQFQWVSGGSYSYPEECSYVVKDVNDDIIFEGSNAMTEPVNYTVDCTVPTCAKPQNFTINYIGGDTAELSWDSEASSFDIDVNGTVIEGVTENPYTLTDLDLSTDYEVKVRANCGDGDYSNWTYPVSFTTTDCLLDDMCNITYVLKANAYQGAYDYGWYGSGINVINADTEELIDFWTVDAGESTNAGTLPICDGKNLRFEWYCYYSSGNDNILVESIEIYDVNGDEIVSVTGPMTSSVDYTVDCTLVAVAKPTNLAASEVGSTSATLSWTENGEATAWEICLNDDVENLIAADSNPFTLANLTPETEYTVKVRATNDGEVSNWSNVVTFTTEATFPAPTDLAVSDVYPNSATISWTGNENATSYDLRYRVAKGFNYGFETADPWAVDDFAPCTTFDGDGVETYCFSSWSFTNQNYTGACIAFQNDNDGSSNMYSHSGNAFGVMFNPASVAANDWFILPEITIQDGDVFSFWAREITDSYGPEVINVGICGDTEGTFETLLDENLNISETVWTQHSYDLSAYAGETIKLAINCVSNDIFGFMFDDIFVGNYNEWDKTIEDVTSPYELAGLVDGTLYQVQVCNNYDEGSSKWESTCFVTPEMSVLELVDSKDNLVIIEEYADNGYIGDVKLTDRTLYKDGGWNTLVLPFAVENIDATPLAGAIVKTLESASFDNGTLTLNFTDDSENLTALDAGVPYIVKWAETGADIVDPVFSNVKISAETENLETDVVSFIGTYNTIDFGTEVNTSVFLMGAGNTLFYPNGESNSYVNTCRAYFQLADGYELATDASVGQNAKVVRVDFNFGDGHGIATGIVSLDDSQNNAGVYTLSGVKLDKATKKGVYIQNGRKVVIGKNR